MTIKKTQISAQHEFLELMCVCTGILFICVCIGILFICVCKGIVFICVCKDVVRICMYKSIVFIFVTYREHLLSTSS